jgi:hypothetical protein
LNFQRVNGVRIRLRIVLMLLGSILVTAVLALANPFLAALTWAISKTPSDQSAPNLPAMQTHDFAQKPGRISLGYHSAFLFEGFCWGISTIGHSWPNAPNEPTPDPELWSMPRRDSNGYAVLTVT